MQQRRVNFHTLGCKLNFSESSTLAREFERGGFVRVAPDAEADICVINSCSTTRLYNIPLSLLLSTIPTPSIAAISCGLSCA